jgi:hypothetical protein
MTLRFSLLGLIGLTTLAGLASAALVQPSAEWTSVVVSLTVAAVGWQVLRAIFCTGPARAAARGWLVFAVGYLAVALGPWLSSHLAPQLISSKALVYAQMHWRKESLPQQNAPYYNVLTDFNWNGVYDGTSSTIWIDPGWNGRYSAISSGVDPNAPANYFQFTGHWLCAWLFGLVGSVVAAQLHRWREISNQRQEPATPAAFRPFAA